MTSDVLRFLRPPGGVESAHGREDELAVLLREQEEARSTQRARVVFVRGSRGVGKTFLTSQLVAAAARHSVAVFEGGSAREAQRPWGLFAPLVPALLDHASRAGVPEVLVARLAGVLETLEGRGPARERLEVFDALAELLGLVTRASPVLVLPDVEVADRSSLELLRYLLALAGTPGSKLGGLWVVTLRDDAPLPLVVAELLGRVTARTLSLTGLDLDGIRAWLARPEVARRLLEVTQGNPDALGELVGRPVGAVDFFTRRVERVSGPERDVLDVLALAPGGLPAGVVARALGVDVAVVARALDVLAAGRFVAARVQDARATWRLAREQDKQVHAAQLPPGRAGALALALGRALAEAGDFAPAAQLAFEAAPEEGARFGLAAALELLQRGALEEACAVFGRGHPYLAGADRARSAAAWGRALLVLGELSAGARRLLEAARCGAAEPQGLILAAARALVKRGHLRRAGALAGVLARTPAFARAARVLRAQLASAGNHLDEALADCRRVLDEEVTDEAAVEALQVRGKVLLVRGQAAEAQAAFAEAARRAEALELKALAGLARLNEGVAAWKAGQREEAITCWQACAQLEDRVAQAHALANLGSAWAEAGELEHALSALTRALDTFSRFGAPREVALAASNLARLMHFLGDLERAGELSQHALARGGALGEAYLVASAQLTLGAVRLDERRFGEAARTLGEARADFERLGNPGLAALAAGLKARAHLQAGERAQAEVELARPVVEAGSGELEGARLEVALTRGDLCLAAGDLLGATRCATRAREALLARPELDGPLRTHALMARLRAAAGDGSGAQAEFQRAARALDELAQRVPVARRPAFLAVPHRAEVLAALEPTLAPARLPSALRELPRIADRVHGFVGRSSALQRIVRQLEPVGRSNATVLVRGESGTGKELLAEAIHALSSRRQMPLVKVNCAAMVEELLLSELFGHEKGAFTGAVRERKGRFELADGGSIFLDEIGDISPKAQVALLRVLQEREFERVGGSKTVKVDVRVICATNRDLETLIGQGRFCADLYYRLKGVMLELPPLRDRLEDLPLLAQSFLARLAVERGEPELTLSAEALALLGRHHWPGNVRELENVIATAAIFAEGPVITPEAFAHVAELAALGARPARERPASGPVEPPSPSTPAPAAPGPAAPVDPAAPIDWFEVAPHPRPVAEGPAPRGRAAVHSPRAGRGAGEHQRGGASAEDEAVPAVADRQRRARAEGAGPW